MCCSVSKTVFACVHVCVRVGGLLRAPAHVRVQVHVRLRVFVQVRARAFVFRTMMKAQVMQALLQQEQEGDEEELSPLVETDQEDDRHRDGAQPKHIRECEEKQLIVATHLAKLPQPPMVPPPDHLLVSAAPVFSKAYAKKKPDKKRPLGELFDPTLMATLAAALETWQKHARRSSSIWQLDENESINVTCSNDF